MRRRMLALFARIVVVSLTLVWVGSAPAAYADDDDDDSVKEAKAAARKLLTSGDKKLKSGDKMMGRGKKVEAQEEYLAALADYEAAFEAFSDSKIYFAIGLAEKKLGRYVDALNHFDQFLADVGNESLRARVEEHTNEIKTFLGVIFFRVDPDGATVEVNGTEIGKAPLNRPHYVPPGEHEYTISKEGFKTLSGTVEVEAGEAREDEITLERDLSGEEDKPKKKVVVRKPKKTRAPEKSRTPFIVGLALTGGFALAGSVTGLLALSRHDTFTNDATSPDDRESAQSSGKNLALATDIFLIGAVAAATYTTYYYFAEYRGGSGRERQDRGGDDGTGVAALAPWVTDSAGGIAVSGSF